MLLATAGPLFAAGGYASTTLDQIAAAAQVTKPVLYRHFDSKKALYLALLEKHEADLPGFFELADPADYDTPAELVAAILDNWLDYVRANSHTWVMLFRDSSGDDEIRSVRSGVTVRAHEVMGGFVAANNPELPAAQVEPISQTLTAALAGLALWWIDHPEAEKPTVLAVATRFSAAAFA